MTCLAFILTSASAAAPPSDPDFPLQWGLHNDGQSFNGSSLAGADIGALEAWDIHTGGSLVTVAIIATGVDPHPEFGDRLLEGMAFGANVDPYDSRDAGWVGTHMAGIIAAAHDGIGIAGIHPHVRILPFRVVGANSISHVANAIRRAADRGVDIIVIAHQFPDDNTALRSAIEYAYTKGVLLIAAAGHGGESEVAYPARYVECIAVAPTTMADEAPSWANYGSEVELSAPGEHIWSMLPHGAYGWEMENSSALAAAHVAGAASLIRSFAPNLWSGAIRQVLIHSVDDLGPEGRDPQFGYGRVNAGAALGALAPGSPRFDFTWNLPEYLPPSQPITRPIRIAGGFRTISPQTAKMIYRVPPAGVGVPIPLQWHGGEDYSVVFPPISCGAAIEYYLSVVAQGGFVLVDPPSAPLELRTATSLAFANLLAEDFEEDLGWETTAVGTDTTGEWARVAPVGTSFTNPSMMLQPAYDRTPNAGQTCFVTGQHFGGSAGTNDVDGGPVQLLSPIIMLTGSDAEVSYARWFVTWDGTPDKLRVEFTRDGGGTWTIVEEVTGTEGWERYTFRLSHYGVGSGDQLRLRFTTSDTPRDSLTEAAVDDVLVRAITCESRMGDANGDGGIDVQDWATAAACLTGPGVIIASECWAIDLFGDDRGDLRDAAEFQNLLTAAPN